MTTPTPTLPEALRLADELDAEAGRITQYTNRPGDLLRELAADELRRMHSEVTTLQAELAAMRAGGEPVATIYVTPDGAREMDDWGVPLPEGATTLYNHPQPAAQDAEPDMFWDANDREIFAYDIEEIVSEYDPGQIVSIECAQRLPSFRVLVTAGEDGNSYEYVDAAIAQQKAGE